MLSQRIEPWVPGWAVRAIFYHIYPLGFFDAPQDNPGGDPVPRLADLRRWYDHIAGLGVNALYIGPLFESGSHGYDTTDYFTIDRRLGDNALLRQVIQELHERKIKIILDGVFNHTGREFFAFQDILRKGRSSPYTDWYHLNWGADSDFGDGFAYLSWQGHQMLPKLNLDNPDTRKYIFEVARMWLGDYEIDGWRLDVAGDIPPAFWWEFRRECKAVNPDCFLLGEIWEGDYREWVAPDLLDSGTNYHLYHTVENVFNQGDLGPLRAIMDRASHPEVGIYKDIALFNFIGNHDVTRILSQLEDPEDVFPALIFLLTAPGIPCLYYGDEVGMMGRKNSDDSAMRKPMLAPDAAWPDRDHRLYSIISNLAGLRKEHPSLLYGSFASLDAGQGFFAYMRRHVRESAVIALNSGSEPLALTLPVAEEGLRDGVSFHDLLDPDAGLFAVDNGALTIPNIRAGWGRLLIADA